MSRKILTFLSISVNIISVICEVSGARAGHGLIGYGIEMYQPNCAYACRAVLASSTLDCSSPAMEMPGMSGMSAGASTDPECYATDDSFLQTLAWCVSSRCKDDVPLYTLERYWLLNVAGTQKIQPNPKYSYQHALAVIAQPPKDILVAGDPLNTTLLVSDMDYIATFNAQQNFEEQEDLHERYG